MAWPPTDWAAALEYVLQVEGTQNGVFQDVHVFRLKLYFNRILNKEAIISEVLSYATGLAVVRLMTIVKDDEGAFKIGVRLKNLLIFEDSLEPLWNEFENVSALLIRVLDCKTTTIALANDARVACDL